MFYKYIKRYKKYRKKRISQRIKKEILRFSERNTQALQESSWEEKEVAQIEK